MGIPVTLLTASLLGFVLLVIVLRNAAARGRVMRAEREGPVPADMQAELDHRLRVVANFTEYVPFSLLLMAALELSPLAIEWVIGLAVLLVSGRVLHAWGYSRSRGPSFGRFAGTSLTWIMVLVGCSAGLYMVLFA